MSGVIERYFEAFNNGDVEDMLACLTEDMEHHVNEGSIRRGKAAFAEFCAHMGHCYAEKISDLVVFETADGRRGAAEYTVTGTYLQTDAGLPPARGQTYELTAGSFFDLRDGKISRVTTRYNLSDWIAQVTAADDD